VDDYHPRIIQELPEIRESLFLANQLTNPSGVRTFRFGSKFRGGAQINEWGNTSIMCIGLSARTRPKLAD
jgi:hypothetical protein